ncbi:MAG: hypothetical protein LBP53_06895 [Candidatus Peribacteria bacterium]|nr:hypothetical protein [Candidatus Peribacteria bacterium]
MKQIPNFAKWRFRLTGFVSAVCVFLFVFILSFFTDFFAHKLSIPSKYTQVENFPLPEPLPEETPQIERKNALQIGFIKPITTVIEESYLYDGKHYPKVAEKMPIYKHVGILGNEEKMIKTLQSLKFGNLSLKGSEAMVLTELVLRNPENASQTIEINGNNATLSFGEMSNGKEYFSVLQEKGIKKGLEKLEKLLHSFNIPMQQYGEPQIMRNDEAYISILYPFLLQEKYLVWDTTTNQPLGMEVAYEVRTDTFSIYNINIAKYEYTNVPTLPKDEMLKEFTWGTQKLNAPELVYVVKYLEEERYYVP